MRWVDTVLDAVVAATPDGLALICGARRWSFGRLQAERDRRAGVLVDRGLRPGERVLVAERTDDDFLLTCLAVIRAGGVFAFLSPTLTEGDLAALARQIAPTLVLLRDDEVTPALVGFAAAPISLPGTPTAGSLQEAARRATAWGADDPCNIRTTSGTTGGRPRLAVRPYRQLVTRLGQDLWLERLAGVNYFQVNTGLPHQQYQVLCAGGTVVLPSAETVNLERELVEQRVEILSTVPAHLAPYARLGTPAPAGLALRAIRTTAAPLDARLAERLERRYGVPIIHEYALSECSRIMGPPGPTVPSGSIGQPLPWSEVRLLDGDGRAVADGEMGEIVVRSPLTMLGYLDDPEATAAVLRDGWLHTGDLARRDAAGFYYLLGRKNLLINAGGLKVWPEEVEAVLLRHPGVREVVVVAAPDASRGAIVAAIVVPATPAPTVGELQRFCRAYLAGHKIPRRIEFRDTLPRSPLGKVLRQRL